MFNKYKNLLSLLLILIPILLETLCYHKCKSKNNLIEGFLFGGSQDNVLTKNEVLKDIKASTNNNQPFKFSSLFLSNSSIAICFRTACLSSAIFFSVLLAERSSSIFN